MFTTHPSKLHISVQPSIIYCTHHYYRFAPLHHLLLTVCIPIMTSYICPIYLIFPCISSNIFSYIHTIYSIHIYSFYLQRIFVEYILCICKAWVDLKRTYFDRIYFYQRYIYRILYILIPHFKVKY